MVDLIKNNGNNSYQYMKSISIKLGTHEFKELIAIKCPLEDSDQHPHLITRNGHDTSTKRNSQQYRCKDCHRSFFAHTSKFIIDAMDSIPGALVEVFSKGDLSIKKLATFFHIPNYTATRLFNRFLYHALNKMDDYHHYTSKMRNSDTLIIDETFLTIKGKTWYLTIAISGNSEILGFSITPNRKNKVIKALIHKCASKLEHGMKFLISDGFGGYQKVAREWGEDIIHIKHIHSPPYGWAIIDIHHYDHSAWYCASLRLRNDIFVETNGFLTEVYIKKENLEYKRDMPKIEFSDFSLLAQNLETCLKEYRIDGRKKKPKNKKWKKSFYQFFRVNLKKGRVTCYDKNLIKVAARLETLLPLFNGKHITSNLIEIENAIIKKFINFGAKRDLEKWNHNVDLYFTIRDQPMILKELVSGLTVSKQMIPKLLPQLMEVELI